MAEILDAWELETTSTASPGDRTVSAGTDRLLLYHAHLRSPSAVGQTVTAVTYGDQDMVLVASAISAGGGADAHASVWMLDEAGIAAASGTTFGIVRSTADAVTYRAFTASYENVEQGDPIVDAFAVVGENGTPATSQELETSPFGIVLAAIAAADESGGTQDATWGNLSEQIEEVTTAIYASIAEADSTGVGFTPSVTPANMVNTVLLGYSLRAANDPVAALLDAWALVSVSAAAALTGEPFAVSSGVDRLLVVAIGEESSSHEPTAVAYGGETMTLIRLAQSTGGFPISVSFWMLDDAGIQAAADTDIVVTLDGTHNGQFRMFAASYQRIKQADPVIDTHGAVGAGSVADPALLATIGNGIAVGMLSNSVAGIDVAWTGATEKLEHNATSTYHSIAVEPTTGVQQSIAPSGGPFNFNAFVAFSLAPSAETGSITGVAPAATAAIAMTAGNISIGQIQGVAPAAEAALAGAVTTLSGSIHRATGSLDVVHELRGEL